MLSPAGKNPFPALGVNIPSVQCHLLQCHQLCVLGFEPWENARGIPGSSDLSHSQPVAFPELLKNTGTHLEGTSPPLEVHRCFVPL